MKLLRYGPPGAERPGLVDADGALRDLSALIPDLAGEVLDPLRLAKLGEVDPRSLPRVDAAVRLGPCVGGVDKIVCVGLNYRSLAAAGFALPREPVIFLKAPSALCGADDPLPLPEGAECVDWEVELAVVIGRSGRNIPAPAAFEHIAGYCVFNDLSERRWQFGDGNAAVNGGQWDKGKNHDGFAPLGPWLVTGDEVVEPHRLDLWLAVDDERMQSANTADLCFGIPELIAEISRYMSLHPGDVIATGTPPGCGFLRQPPRFLRPGQTLRSGIAGLGEQCRRITTA
jgi:2-keto-4-pentenoate hydratase/2-oxohepta-3-ene-1,7-dioic acid hydratase in catechol pathway